jgi:hypothetical protein
MTLRAEFFIPPFLPFINRAGANTTGAGSFHEQLDFGLPSAQHKVSAVEQSGWTFWPKFEQFAGCWLPFECWLLATGPEQIHCISERSLR